MVLVAVEVVSWKWLASWLVLGCKIMEEVEEETVSGVDEVITMELHLIVGVPECSRLLEGIQVVVAITTDNPIILLQSVGEEELEFPPAAVEGAGGVDLIIKGSKTARLRTRRRKTPLARQLLKLPLSQQRIHPLQQL